MHWSVFVACREGGLMVASTSLVAFLHPGIRLSSRCKRVDTATYPDVWVGFQLLLEIRKANSHSPFSAWLHFSSSDVVQALES